MIKILLDKTNLKKNVARWGSCFENFIMLGPIDFCLNFDGTESK